MDEAFYDDSRKSAERAGKKIERDWTDAEKVELANDNHVWLNAFSCIRSTDEFLIDVGRAVLRKLEESPMGEDLSGTGRMIYLRINAS